MSKPNKLTVLPECPDCGAVARDEISYRCASTPWSQSWTCLEDKSRRLQTRIDELETVVTTLGTMQDGTPIHPDREAWFPHPDGGVKFHRVGYNLTEESWCHGESGRGVRFVWTDCYGTREAAEDSVVERDE